MQCAAAHSGQAVCSLLLHSAFASTHWHHFGPNLAPSAPGCDRLGYDDCKVHHQHKQYVFTKEGCTQVSEDQPYLHHLQRVDDDYDPGESDPQDWDKIPSDYRPLIEEFRDIFPKDLPAGLPPVRPHVDHVIPTEGAGPPKARGRKKYSKAETQEMQEQIEALRQKGFIQPSASPWGASILFQPKKNGKLRMCFDYRVLNNMTRRDRYSLPRVDELLDHLQGSKVFSGIDLASGYHQVRISEEDIPKTAFQTPWGAYEFKVMCFGLTNAPATFQRVMNEIFRPYLGKFVLIYLDDILVYSKTPEEHKVHLRIVLSLLRKHRLYGRLVKTDFGKSEMPFLGHVVSADGVSVDPAKTAAIQRWKPLDSLREVQSFLEFANWFRMYIPGYSQKIGPLTELTKKNVPFIWSPECQNCFDWLKGCLQEPPVLALPDYQQQFEVRADASSTGVGAVLMQGGRPLAYESAAFALAERNYTIGEQELLAVVFALKKWRTYLEGGEHPVRIVTDHLPPTYLPTKGTLGPRQVRWSEYLSRFHLEWVHTAGKNNVADVLSRMPCLAAFVMTRALTQSQSQTPVTPMPTSAVDSQLPPVQSSEQQEARATEQPEAEASEEPDQETFLEEVRSGYAGDPFLARPSNRKRLTQNVGLWWFNKRTLYVPECGTLREQCISHVHDHPYSGHGWHETHGRVALKNLLVAWLPCSSTELCQVM